MFPPEYQDPTALSCCPTNAMQHRYKTWQKIHEVFETPQLLREGLFQPCICADRYTPVL